MRMKNRLISAVLTICILTGVCLTGLSVSAAYTPDFAVNSEIALLVDLESEKVIYSKEPDKPWYPASLAKIMTCLITLEQIPDEELSTTMMTASVDVYNELYGQGASSAGIEVGDTTSALDLLYGLMLPSGCETALILADNIGQGDTYEERTSDFVRMMNEKAQELGCSEQTRFMNAHGLHDPDQMVTANDLWKILKYAIETYDRFIEISTALTYTMHATGKNGETRDISISHSNYMLREKMYGEDNKYYSPYVQGIKTGTLDAAGRNLVTMGSDKGVSYILITMGAPSKYENGDPIADNLSFLDHKNLFNWVFKSFELKTVYEKSSTAAQISVSLAKDKDTLLLNPSDDVMVLLPKNVELSSVQKLPHLPETIEAPVEKGQQIGTMDLKLNDEVIATVPQVASETIERSGFLYAMHQIKGFFGSLWFKIALAVIVAFLIIYVLLIIRYNRKKRRRKNRVYPRRPL